jgi:glycosyltransferase involved in cell wall biosynthesis
MSTKAWVSFCISTYKRPELLKQQLTLLQKQTFEDFNIVVSDNDPEASAKKVCESLTDNRIKYFHNGDNLGMIKSFNKSIERAETKYIVMVTDDDPIEFQFLSYFHKIYKQHPQYSVYCGFGRKKANFLETEYIKKENFIQEIIDPDKTYELLWSSSIVKRDDALAIGSIPDYGSPHLADHAFLALVGNVNGGVIVNKMFSSLTSHNTNFSKSHFESYLSGCKGFYFVFNNLKHTKQNEVLQAVLKHLKKWFIGCVFNLKKYYTVKQPDQNLVEQINEFANEILKLDFMKKFKLRFQVKEFVFQVKKRVGLLS